MKNNKTLVLSLLGIPAFSFFACSEKSSSNPNFVFVIADDVSWNDLGCYGNEQVKTPNIDGLSSSGLRFTNVFLTASSSSPSRNSIITGRYPHNTGGAELHTLPPDHMVAFTELLKNNGYYTAQAGKFHMGNYARRGFDTINEIGKLNGDGGEEQWLKLLHQRPQNKPFFMWFASYDAHRPWGPNDLSGINNPEICEPPFYLVDGEKTKTDLAKYYDEISRLDSYVGAIVDELKSQSILNNTVIIIMADNGRPFPHSKTRVTDRGLKTPFIIFWPDGIGINPMECNSLVSSIDIAPTILDIAGIDVPDHFQGYSFYSLLENPDKKFRNYVFGEHNWHDYEAHERMVRSDSFLYILNSRPQFANLGPADALSGDSYIEMLEFREKGLLTTEQAEIFMAPRPSEELFNCMSDPDQLINIVSDIKYRNKLQSMQDILSEWMRDTGDNIPDSITKDWYERSPGNKKTADFNIRGEPVSERFDATLINNKGRF